MYMITARAQEASKCMHETTMAPKGQDGITGL